MPWSRVAVVVPIGVVWRQSQGLDFAATVQLRLSSIPRSGRGRGLRRPVRPYLGPTEGISAAARNSADELRAFRGVRSTNSTVSPSITGDTRRRHLLLDVGSSRPGYVLRPDGPEDLAPREDAPQSPALEQGFCTGSRIGDLVYTLPRRILRSDEVGDERGLGRVI